MTLHDDKTTGAAERRRATRRDTDLHLEVTLDERAIRGRAENISSAGVFFFSSDSLDVSVRIRDDVTSQVYTGKLVRVERLSSETIGYAIEFDRA